MWTDGRSGLSYPSLKKNKNKKTFIKALWVGTAHNKRKRKEMQADCVSGRLINIDRNVDDLKKFFYIILRNKQ